MFVTWFVVDNLFSLQHPLIVLGRQSSALVFLWGATLFTMYKPCVLGEMAQLRGWTLFGCS